MSVVTVFQEHETCVFQTHETFNMSYVKNPDLLSEITGFKIIDKIFVLEQPISNLTIISQRELQTTKL